MMPTPPSPHGISAAPPGTPEDRETRLKLAAGRAIAQEYSDRMSHAVPTVSDLQLIHRFIFDEVSPNLGELKESEIVDVESELQLLEKQTGEMLATARTPADKACAVAFWQARFAVLSPFKHGSDRVGAVVLMTQAREVLAADRTFPAKLVEHRSTFRVGVMNAARAHNLGPLASTLMVAAGKRDEVSFAQIDSPFNVMPLESEAPVMMDERYRGSLNGRNFPGSTLKPGTSIILNEKHHAGINSNELHDL